jgi:hypothetical protein
VIQIFSGSTAGSSIQCECPYGDEHGQDIGHRSFADQATIVIKPSDNCFIRMLTPSEALTLNGTLTLKEMGLG